MNRGEPGTAPAAVLVAQLLFALRDQSDALKSGSVARAALADARRRWLLRLLTAPAPRACGPAALDGPAAPTNT